MTQKKIPTYIKEMVRQRWGLAKDDARRDAEIDAAGPLKLLRAVCGWKLGDPFWADEVMGWAKDCGFALSKPRKAVRTRPQDEAQSK